MTPIILTQAGAIEMQVHMLPSQPGSVAGLTQAREICAKAIAELGQKHDFVILDERTIERPFGWVFFYTTRKYSETHDPRFLVPGTAPMVVQRVDGKVMPWPSSIPPQVAIERYEAQFGKTLHTNRP